MRISDIVFQHTAAIFTADGCQCMLQFTPPHAWRLRTAENGVFDDFGAGQTLARDLGEAVENAALPLRYEAASQTLFAPDGSRAVLTSGEGVDFFTPAGQRAHGVDRLLADRQGVMHVGGRLEANERLYGTGERFDAVDQRGKRVEIFALDRWMEWRGNSYVPVPIAVSSRGCGFFMNRFERQTFDLGCSEPDRFDIELTSGPVDLYVFAVDRIADVLYGYSAVTGFAPPPAPWLYGTQVCRYAPEFTTAQGVIDMAENMEKNGFPWEAVIIEGFNAFDRSRWDELKLIADHVHGKGKKLMLYHACGSVWDEVDEFFGTQDRYLLHTADGGVQIPDAGSYNPADNPDPSARRYVDITSDAARNWWFGGVWGALSDQFGIDGSKIDFCELLSDFEPLRFADGRKTGGAHHWYPTLYNTMMYQFFARRPAGGMNLSRGGGIGAQRYPFLWAGDQRREYWFLGCVLKACLSAGLSGIPFMSFDMAGYRPAADETEDPEAQVFVRGLQMACFSANIQTHGTVSRPYDFDEATKNLYRVYANLHEALRPYLRECGETAGRTALPLMRALILCDQSDEICADIWDEYLLGDAFLVAPLLDRRVRRDVYLPAGEWEDLYSGERYAGRQTLRDYDAPLAKVPVFVNTAAASPALAQTLRDAAPFVDEINALCAANGAV